MSVPDFVAHLQSLVVPIVIFVTLLIFVMVQGRRALTSLILGLYLGLLFSVIFPYYDQIFNTLNGALNDTLIRVLFFAIFTAAGALLFDRLLFYRIDESAFESLPKKSALAFIATVLILAFSYHVLPFSPYMAPESIIPMLFSPEDVFFWWLILPLLVLFLL